MNPHLLVTTGTSTSCEGACVVITGGVAVVVGGRVEGIGGGIDDEGENGEVIELLEGE